MGSNEDQTEGKIMNKWNELDSTTKAIYAIEVAVSAAYLAVYLKVTKRERIRRRKIREWKRMNKSAIEATRARLRKMADDPACTANDIIEAYREEKKFLDIIQNQPMY
jgi:hypothetical protein